MEEEKQNETIRQLEHENARLKKALKEIGERQDEIRKLLEEVGDLLNVEEPADNNTPVTEEDVKSLLKKYARV
ncbi:MAG: hypothetical protein II776_05415 [Clostridia bacterium]|nr:hypothetical protein [Clostridia bacterium]